MPWFKDKRGRQKYLKTTTLIERIMERVQIHEALCRKLAIAYDGPNNPAPYEYRPRKRRVKPRDVQDAPPVEQPHGPKSEHAPPGERDVLKGRLQKLNVNPESESLKELSDAELKEMVELLEQQAEIDVRPEPKHEQPQDADEQQIESTWQKIKDELEGKEGRKAERETPYTLSEPMRDEVREIATEVSVDIVQKFEEAHEVIHAEEQKRVGKVIARANQETIKKIEKRVEERLKQVRDATPVIVEVKHPDKTTVEVGLAHKLFPRLLALCNATGNGRWVNVWIAGPAGSGKSWACKQAAEALKRPFYTNGAVDAEHKLMGHTTATGTIVSTPFRAAFPKESVYLFDELDASSANATLAFMNALANGWADFPGQEEIVERHEYCVIAAAGNTFGYGANGQYVGRNKLDAAFLNRFVHLLWDYDVALERKLAGNDDVVDRILKLRTTAENRGLRVIISPRQSIFAASLVNVGLSLDDAMDHAVLAQLSPQDRKSLEAV
jgi:hypothetical protein